LPKRPDRPADPDEARARAELARVKQASTLQLLFRASRLLDEQALARMPTEAGRPRMRRSHTALLPHIDLDGTRVTDLADRVGVSKQAISQLVDDLEAAGVVSREADPEDARAKRVVFTPRGRQGILEGLALLRAMEAELAAEVGARRMEELRATLVAILAVIDPPPDDAEAGG